MVERIVVRNVDAVYDSYECDPGVAMELRDHFTFDVPGAKFSPQVRNGWWDGKIRLFQLRGNRLYRGLLTDVYDFCRERDYELDLGEMPVDAMKPFKPDDYRGFNDDVLNVPSHIEERDYQVSTICKAITDRMGLFLSPTASGKSFIIYAVSRYYQVMGGKILIITPRSNLVQQMRGDFLDYGCPEDLVHVVDGHGKSTTKPITITTWQAVYKMPPEWFEQFTVLIGDEAHGFKAKSLITLSEKCTNTFARFGFTGTLDDTQTHLMVLKGLFGPVTTVTTTKELMDRGFVSALKAHVVVLHHPKKITKRLRVKEYNDEIEFLIGLKPRNRFITKLATEFPGNTLVLFTRVSDHGDLLNEMIAAEIERKNRIGHGLRDLRYVHGGVAANDREEVRRILEQATIPTTLLASYGTFSEGANVKRIHYIVFASPYKSKIKVAQSIGRGLRTADDKDFTTLFDMSDDLSWKSRRNHTIKHMEKRVELYAQEGFDYRVYPVPLNYDEDDHVLKYLKEARR